MSLPRLYWAWPTVPDDHPDSPRARPPRQHPDRRRRLAARAGPRARRPGRQGRLGRQRHQGDRRPVHDRGDRRRGEDAQGRRGRPASRNSTGSSPSRRPQAELTRALAKFEKSDLCPAHAAPEPGLRAGDRLPREGRPGLLPPRHRPLLPGHPGRPRPGRATYLVARQGRPRSRPDRARASRRPTAVTGRPRAVDGPRGRDRRPARPRRAPTGRSCRARRRRGEFTPPAFVSRTLSNGIEVWLAPWKTLPIVDRPADRPRRHGRRPRGQGRPRRADRHPAHQGDEGQDRDRAGRGARSRWASATRARPTRRHDPGLQRPGPQPRPGARRCSPRSSPPPGSTRPTSPASATSSSPSCSRGPTGSTGSPSGPSAPCSTARITPTAAPATASSSRSRRSPSTTSRRSTRAGSPPNRAKLIVVGRRRPRRPGRRRSKRRSGPGRPTATRPAPRPEATEGRSSPGVIYLVDKPGAVQSVLRVGRRWVGRTRPEVLRDVDRQPRLRRRLPQPAQQEPPREERVHLRRPVDVLVPADRERLGLGRRRSGPTSPAAALKEMLARARRRRRQATRSTPEEIALGRDALTRSFPESFEDPGSIAGTLETIAGPRPARRLPLDLSRQDPRRARRRS